MLMNVIYVYVYVIMDVINGMSKDEICHCYCLQGSLIPSLTTINLHVDRAMISLPPAWIAQSHCSKASAHTPLNKIEQDSCWLVALVGNTLVGDILVGDTLVSIMKLSYAVKGCQRMSKDYQSTKSRDRSFSQAQIKCF